jgi:hypothetical protein
MALKPCEECKQAIRHEERVCPHCGRKQAASKSQVGKFALVLFALVFGIWVFDATNSNEPQRTISAAAPTPAAKAVSPPEPLSALEQTLQARCGRQTDENGNWIVKGAENRARCRVQVELEMERNQRAAARASENPEPLAARSGAPARSEVSPRFENSPRSGAIARSEAAPRVAHPPRFVRTSRARVVHEAPRKVAPAASPATSAAAASAPAESPRPMQASEPKGTPGPGDDLTPLAPIAAPLGRDPVPGEPMTVRPDGAFL